MEAYLKWGDLSSARRELKSLENLLPAAQKKLAGPDWAASWADWDGRLEKAEAKIAESSKPLQSPRHED